MPDRTYVITGATGHVGAGLAHGLLDAGQKVRVVGRSAERLAPFTARGAEACVGHAEDVEFLTRAFTGADAVFLLVPPNMVSPDYRAEQRRVTAAYVAAVRADEVHRLRAAGVRHVLNLSSVGAHNRGNGPVDGLGEQEVALAGVAGLNVLNLRPCYFMENHLAGIGMIKGMNIYGSATAANVKLPMIATRDIVAAGLPRLLALDFSGQRAMELLGPAEFTMAEVTKVIGAAIGKPELPYVAFPPEDARQGMIAAGLSPSVAGLFVEMGQSISAGNMNPTEARTAANTTPTTLAQFIADTFVPAYNA
jgi:uncharacterized protein YbjT (DUF2867 family)